MNGQHTLKHLESHVPVNRLTPKCACGSKADLGFGVDHPAGERGRWVCRKCHKATENGDNYAWKSQ